MKTRGRRWTALLAVLAAAGIALTLTGCGKKKPPSETEHPKNGEHPGDSEHPSG